MIKMIVLVQTMMDMNKYYETCNHFTLITEQYSHAMIIMIIVNFIWGHPSEARASAHVAASLRLHIISYDSLMVHGKCVGNFLRRELHEN